MKKRLLSLIIILTLVFGITITSEGFGVSVRAGVSSNSCEVGKEATVTLTYSGSNLFAAQGTLSYDSSALELIGAGGSITSRNGNGFLMETTGASSMSATFTFKAKKAGRYSVTATTSQGMTMDGVEFSCGAATGTVTVKEPAAPKPSKPSSGSNTNSGTPNRRGDFKDSEKVEDEPEEEEPQEKPEQVEVEIGDKTYIICEDIKEEDAPAGFKLTTVKYGEWDWEVSAYTDEDGAYVLICLMDKETGEREFFVYDAEGGAFKDKISVSVKDFIEYNDLKAEAAEAENEEKSGAKYLVPALVGLLVAAAAYAAVLQVMILRKRKNTDHEIE